MRRTTSWKPEQTQVDNVVKQTATKGHVNVSGGRSGPVVSTFPTRCVGPDIDKKRDTKVYGPDSGLSWMVAVVTFVVSMISSSYARCLGFFFSAFMSTFDVSRAEASLPLAVYVGFMFLSGLFAAILIPAFGTRISTIIGATCLILGLCVSFFASGVTVLIFTAGFLSGSGHGIIINSGVVCVSQYFDKRRGVALGLNMAGATIASMVFPKLYEYLLAEYGLHGTFLIIGASMGNMVPLAMIMKAPPWKVAALKGNTIDSDATDSSQKPYDAPVAGAVYGGQDKLYLEIERPALTSLQSNEPPPTSQVHRAEGICRKVTAISLNEMSSITASQSGSIVNITGDAKIASRCSTLPSGRLPTKFRRATFASCTEENLVSEAEKPSSTTETRKGSNVNVTGNTKMSRRSTLLPGHLSTLFRRGTFASCSGESSASQADAPDLNELRARRGTILSVAGSMYTSNKISRRSIASNAGLSRRATVTSTSKSQELYASPRCRDSLSHELPTYQEETPSSTSMLQNIQQVLKNPRFYFHALSYVSWGFFTDCFLSVIFDFAQDADVARANTVHALTFYSATDTVGRLLVPCLSDYNLISNCGLLTIAYLMLSLLQQVAPYVRGKECVWALAGAMGLPAGYIMVGASQILSTEIGTKNLPIAYGFMNTATAMGCFVKPLLIGECKNILLVEV
uniref:Monocarboxylate transporter n=1 Tax=Rhipicephalus zambeziensis TaxID=60191 RepID=A0A224Z2A7_9ACAR